MSLQKYNKGTAAALAGAIVTIIASFYAMDSQLQGAVQTILVTLLVVLIPNKEA